MVMIILVVNSRFFQGLSFIKNVFTKVEIRLPLAKSKTGSQISSFQITLRFLINIRQAGNFSQSVVLFYNLQDFPKLLHLTVLVNILRHFDILPIFSFTTSLKSYRCLMDVETTSCVYWGELVIKTLQMNFLRSCRTLRLMTENLKS